jgi:hypothetical protein
VVSLGLLNPCLSWDRCTSPQTQNLKAHLIRSNRILYYLPPPHQYTIFTVNTYVNKTLFMTILQTTCVII